MGNFWFIAKHEYWKKVANKRFWVTSLSVPLLLSLVMVVAIFLALRADRSKPLGYVDQTGLLKSEAWEKAKGDEDFVVMRAFPDQDTAQKALETGEIQAFYVLPADYMSSQSMSLYYKDENPGEIIQGEFIQFVHASLVSGLPENVQQRLIQPPKVTVRAMDGSKEISQGNVAGLLLPFIAGFVLVFSVMMSAGSLMQVVADEKENRTMEVLITTISPEQLIGGKVIGLMLVTFTQMAVWGAAIVGGVVIGSQYFDFLKNIQVPWDFLLLITLFFIPTYALIAGVMTSIGGSVTEVTQGQQVAGVVNMIFMLPLFLTAVIMMDPGSPLVMVLTIFPTTAFSTIVLRWGFSVIPTWQLAVSWTLLVVSALLAVWGSARIFRLGMLRYGKSLDLRTALSSLVSRDQ